VKNIRKLRKGVERRVSVAELTNAVNEIGSEVKAIRGDLSQEKFARVLKTSTTVICDAENKGKVSKKLAKKLAALSEKPLEFFIR
jgi:DNA-binding transcriptional regulator YiaG